MLPMNIAVCIKQVPDTTEVRIDPETNALIREGVPSIVNPFDAHAAEEAVRLKERYGGTVTILCMGPPQATEAIKKCIGYGADRGILLSDRAFAGSDTWATSYIIAAGLQRLMKDAPLDLIMCGKQAIDGDTAQVGPGLARRLNIPQVTYAISVDEVDMAGRTMKVGRRLEHGVEVVETPLPALVTCVEEMNEIRYSSLPNMIRAARYKCEQWTRADLVVEDELLGFRGSPTVVSRIFPPPAREPGEMIPNGATDPAGAINTLVERLLARVGAGATA
jgi:electron transfer flavoprotein beta subunit